MIKCAASGDEGASCQYEHKRLKEFTASVVDYCRSREGRLEGMG